MNQFTHVDKIKQPTDGIRSDDRNHGEDPGNRKVVGEWNVYSEQREDRNLSSNRGAQSNGDVGDGFDQGVDAGLAHDSPPSKACWLGWYAGAIVRQHSAC